MFEQQFIRFTKTIDPTKQEIALPISDDHGYSFFYYRSEEDVRIDIVTPNGELIKENQVVIGDGKINTDEKLRYIWCTMGIVSDIVAEGEYFRLRMIKGENIDDPKNAEWFSVEYSNLLRNVGHDDYLAPMQYYCNEPQFGFPFYHEKRNFGMYKQEVEVALPIHLSKPQFKQTDKIYETRNGEQIVLYATINKEYSGETDYIPEEWHERIVTALSCDEVYINGERVTKSDSYEIDQDNCTYSECGIRLTRATFKVKTNVTQRNSNC